MRKLISPLAVLLFLGVTGLSAAPKDTAEFKELIKTYWESWSTLNPDKSEHFYAKETDAVFFDLAPLKYNGWEEYKEGVKKTFADAASASIIPNDDLKVTRRGNIAWTSHTFKATINQKDGKSVQIPGRHTGVWEKRGGRWIIVHEHVSAPLPG